MILVDSSVWIDHLRRRRTRQVEVLEGFLSTDYLMVGDLILYEVLAGVRTEPQARTVENTLGEFPIVSLCRPDLAVAAAANYRLLRSRGITVRKTIDMIIGTFCIEHGHVLLHSDRDFEPMERYLGLRSV